MCLSSVTKPLCAVCLLTFWTSLQVRVLLENFLLCPLLVNSSANLLKKKKASKISRHHLPKDQSVYFEYRIFAFLRALIFNLKLFGEKGAFFEVYVDCCGKKYYLLLILFFFSLPTFRKTALSQVPTAHGLKANSRGLRLVTPFYSVNMLKFHSSF